MQMCPFCGKVYDESEYTRCPYCGGRGKYSNHTVLVKKKLKHKRNKLKK